MRYDPLTGSGGRRDCLPLAPAAGSPHPGQSRPAGSETRGSPGCGSGCVRGARRVHLTPWQHARRCQEAADPDPPDPGLPLDHMRLLGGAGKVLKQPGAPGKVLKLPGAPGVRLPLLKSAGTQTGVHPPLLQQAGGPWLSCCRISVRRQWMGADPAADLYQIRADLQRIWRRCRSLGRSGPPHQPKRRAPPQRHTPRQRTVSPGRWLLLQDPLQPRGSPGGGTVGSFGRGSRC